MKKKGGSTKSSLASLPQKARDEIESIMANENGQLPLEQYLAKRWNVVECWSESRSEEEVEELVDEVRSTYQHYYPNWTAKQIDIAASFANLTEGLTRVAIARRFALDEPKELARALCVVSKVSRLTESWSFTEGQEPCILEACVVREFETAQSLVAGKRPGITAVPTDGDLLQMALSATLQSDNETLQIVTGEMQKRKVRPWIQGIYEVYSGVAAGSPAQVAKGLELNLTGLQQMKQKDALVDAVNLGAQGLYRLAEWVSPDLVREFDPSHAFPWDATFHVWCEEHPDPLEGTDLTDISSDLHTAIVLGKPAKWMTPPLKERFEIVLLSANPQNSRAIEQIGGCAGTSGSPHEAKKIIEQCPVTLRWNIDRDYGEQLQKYFKELGAKTEVRPMALKPFRPVDVGRK